MPSSRRAGMAIYTAVLATASIVSLLAMTSMAVVRVERQQRTAIGNRLAARSNARSAVELALAQIARNSSWRTAHSHNAETAPLSLGVNGTGTVSWKLADSDNSLTNADQALTLKGIGRVGSIVQVSSVRIQPGSTGPGTLRSHTSSFNIQAGRVENDAWWGQYFKPSLPAEANGWRVSSVELYCQRKESNQNVTVRLYRASLDSVNVIDSATLSSNGFPDSWAWYTINFSAAYWLNSNEAAFVTLETSDNAPVEVQYRDGGVFEADSALIHGTPNWNSYWPWRALRYRINGYYTTSAGVTVVPASWQWATP